jgi:hypothetical protein
MIQAAATGAIHQRVNVRVLELIDTGSGSRIELEGMRLPITHSTDVIQELTWPRRCACSALDGSRAPTAAAQPVQRALVIEVGVCPHGATRRTATGGCRCPSSAGARPVRAETPPLAYARGRGGRHEPDHP